MGSEKADLQSEKVDMRFRRAWGVGGGKQTGGQTWAFGAAVQKIDKILVNSYLLRILRTAMKAP